MTVWKIFGVTVNIQEKSSEIIEKRKFIQRRYNLPEFHCFFVRKCHLFFHRFSSNLRTFALPMRYIGLAFEMRFYGMQQMAISNELWIAECLLNLIELPIMAGTSVCTDCAIQSSIQSDLFELQHAINQQAHLVDYFNSNWIIIYILLNWWNVWYTPRRPDTFIYKARLCDALTDSWDRMHTQLVI